MSTETENFNVCPPVVWWKKREIVTAIIVGLIIVAIWIFTPFVVHKHFEDWGKSGQFGDVFGSVNALFSGLAFVALIYTIHLQRQELALQRTELKLQRDEMAASRGELAAQVAIQKLQLRVTIAQIKVSAEQARIEELKVFHTENRKNIKNIAIRIDEIANELEKF
jgi:hypothetical protein